MKKILILSIISIFSITVPAFSNQLLTNGDFENGILSGWTQLFPPSWSAETTVVHQGAISAKNTISTINNQDYFASLYQDCTAAQCGADGQTIYATLFVKTDLEILSNARAGLLLEFYNGNTFISSAKHEVGGLNDWRQLYVSAVIPTETTKTRFHVFVFAPENETQGGGIALGGVSYFDEAVLSSDVIPPPPPQTDLVNPSFENGYVDWERIFPVAGQLSIEQVAVDGLYSAKFTLQSSAVQSSFAAAFQRLQYQSGPVFAEAMVKTAIDPLSQASAELKLEYRDINLNSLGFEKVSLQGNNSWTRLLLDNSGLGYTPPPGTYWIDVLVLTFVPQNDTLSNGGTANFDKVIFSYNPLPPNFRTDLINGDFDDGSGLSFWSQLFGFPTELDTAANSAPFNAKKTVGQIQGIDYFSLLSQDIYFNSSGNDYPTNTFVNASVMVKTDFNPSTNANLNLAGIQLEALDAQGAVIGVLDTHTAAGVNPYELLYVSGTTPVGTKKVRVGLFDYSLEAHSAFTNMISRFDDVQFSLSQLPVPPPQKKLLNGGFENGRDHWDQENKPYALSLTTVLTGNLSLEFEIDSETNPSGQNYFGSGSQLIKLSPGRRVTAKVWAKSAFDPATNSTANLTIEFLDANQQTIGPIFSKFVSGQTNWTELKITKTSPAGTAYLKYTLSVFADKDDVPSPIGDQAWFDDGSVRIGFIAVQPCLIGAPCP